ncbi:MAG: hypothetical protein QF780_01935, partial [Candidatus Marinimicrobia bacterium]|nr:hypothetical protein [Candidatus Neomarinimicrobiota bacterium]
MNRILTFFILFVVGSVALFPQRSRHSKKPRINVEKFVLAPFPDAIHSDSVKVVTFMEIPYYSLQFVKEGDSYSAYYQASLSIRDKKGKDIEHIIWSDSIQVDLYSDTRSMMKNKKHFTEFNVPIGNRYEVVGELQDLDTRKKG